MERKIKIGMHVIASRQFKEESIKPKLLLQGDWLKDHGFEPGEYVFVHCSHGTLTIKKAFDN